MQRQMYIWTIGQRYNTIPMRTQTNDVPSSMNSLILSNIFRTNLPLSENHLLKSECALISMSWQFEYLTWSGIIKCFFHNVTQTIQSKFSFYMEEWLFVGICWSVQYRWENRMAIFCARALQRLVFPWNENRTLSYSGHWNKKTSSNGRPVPGGPWVSTTLFHVMSLSFTCFSVKRIAVEMYSRRFILISVSKIKLYKNTSLGCWTKRIL